MLAVCLLLINFLAVLCVGQEARFLVVYPCAENGTYQQQWTITNGVTANFSTISMSGQELCIDCNGCANGELPWTYACDTDPDANSNSNQWWSILDSSSNDIVTNLTDRTFRMASYSQQNGECLSSVQGNNIFSDFQLKKCSTTDQKQMFTYNEKTKQFVMTSNKSLCLTVNSGIGGNTQNCSVEPFSSYTYCNPAEPIPVRVKDLLSRMTIFEKVTNMQNSNNGVPRLAVPPNGFGEALHGVLVGCGSTYGNNTGCPTSFPHALLLSATFNRSLWHSVGAMISTEGRALHNQGIAGLYFWAPDINLFRDPRWGRGQEVPGEDPFLTSQYVMEYSHAMQFGVEDPTYLKVVSTAKHFADYDQEGNYGVVRQSFDANVTDQDQVEYYWPAWRAAIQSGGVQSIMCSYNAVNGVPSCGNDYFMNQIARQQWGFEGYFVSDCGAIGDTAFENYIDATYNNSNNSQVLNLILAKVAVESGCDIECGGYYQSNLQAAYNASYVSEDDIDTALGRLLYRMFYLGIMDDPSTQYWKTLGPESVDTPQHRQTALDAAQQGIVLLKNENGTLPLSEDSSVSIALIGPHANATQNMLSNYHGTNTLVNSHSPYQVMQRNYPGTVGYSPGCESMNCSTTSGFEDAITLAKSSDLAIVFLGLCPGGTPGCKGPAQEAEGVDRNNISFPGNQQDLLKQIYEVQSNTILVLINGGILDLTWPKANVPAIIEAFYPGELGGDALYNIIFGNVSPAGKLPVTIYDHSLIEARPTIMDMSLRNNGGITYRYYTGTPLYEFGFGLSYTQFEYEWTNSTFGRNDAKQSISTFDMAKWYHNKKYFYEAVAYDVTVTNVGNMASDCVVLGFVTSDQEDAPLKKLFDFQRVFVPAGQSVNVTLSVSPESISLTNKVAHERVVSGKYNVMIGEVGNFVIGELEMTGKDETLFDLSKIKRRKIVV